MRLPARRLRGLLHRSLGAIAVGFATLALISLPSEAPLAGETGQVPLPREKPAAFSRLTPARSSLKQAHFQGVRLTLADAIFLGVRRNRTIKSAYISRISEKFDLKVAEDIFTPHITLAAEFVRQRIGNTSANSFEVGPEVNMLTRTGAEFQFVWGNTGSLEEGANVVTSAAGISVEQPLLRGAGIRVNTAPVDIARLQEKVNHLKLKATVSGTVATIIFAYRQLLSSQEQLTLTENALSRAESLLQVNEALIQAGRMAAVEKVQTEADVEAQKLAVLQSRRQLSSARITLLQLLNLDLGTQLRAVESLELARVTTDIRDLLQTALDGRPDYQGQLYVLEQNRLGVVIAENEQLWDLDLFANARFGRTFEFERTHTNVQEASAGIRLAIPINDLSRKQALISADVSHTSAQLQLGVIRTEIERQVRESSAEIGYLWEQIRVGTRSVELASRAIDIALAKLNAGRTTTFEVRTLEDNLRTAETRLLQARIDYINALTRLDLQLGTTLETWRIRLND